MVVRKDQSGKSGCEQQPQVQERDLLIRLLTFISREASEIESAADQPLHGLLTAQKIGSRAAKDIGEIPASELVKIVGDEFPRMALGNCLKTRHANSRGYSLCDLKSDLKEHGDRLTPFLYTDDVAGCLGAVLFSGVLFNGSREIGCASELKEVYELIHSKCRGAAAARVTKLAIASLLSGIEINSDPDQINTYVSALGLKDISLSSERSANIRVVLATLIDEGKRLPVGLWKALDKSARDELAKSICIERVLRWCALRLEDALIKTDNCLKAQEVIADGNDVKTEIELKAKQQIRESFSDACRDITEVVYFLVSFNTAKNASLFKDPICTGLQPVTISQKKSYAKDQTHYIKHKLKEHVQDELEGAVNDLFSQLCLCIRQADVQPLSCPDNIRKAAVVLYDELGIVLDGKQVKEAFWAAFERGEYTSALNIRLLCPPSSKDAGPEWAHRGGIIERIAVDEALTLQPHRVVSSFENHYKQLLLLLRIDNKGGIPSAPLSSGIDELMQAIRHFTPALVYRRCDAQFLGAFSNLVRGLILFDKCDDTDQKEKQGSKIFWGCKKAAELIELIKLDADFCSHVMQMALLEVKSDVNQNSSTALDILDEFIVWTKENRRKEADGKSELLRRDRDDELARLLYGHSGRFKGCITKPEQSSTSPKSASGAGKSMVSAAELMRWAGQFERQFDQHEIDFRGLAEGADRLLLSLRYNVHGLVAANYMTIATLTKRILESNSAPEIWSNEGIIQGATKALDKFIRGPLGIYELNDARSNGDVLKDLGTLRNDSSFKELLDLRSSL
ncbi:MAG: hypothetical protein ACK5Y6_06710 [Pseudomonadota bacterium]